MENAQPEPSMEEILASIRRIISEDEEESGEAAKTPSHPVATKPEPEAGTEEASAPESALSPVEAASPEPQEADAAPFEPVEAPVSAEPVASEEDGVSEAAAPLDMTPENEGLEMLKKNVEAAVSDNTEALILDHTAAAAASQAFESLSQSVRVADDGGRTLEDIVVGMLQPMIKDWLDANLPAIVEEKVEEEVKRVSRRRA